MSSNNGVASSSAAKRSILSLPLVPRASRLTERLLPDPITPTPSALVSVRASAPSLLRRSRNVAEGAHFSYVSPLVLEFPYDLKKIEENDGLEDKEDETQAEREQERLRVASMDEEERTRFRMDQARKEMERVEGLMRPYEVDPASISEAGTPCSDQLNGYIPRGRAEQTFPSARLLGFSQECIDDCLPQLDVGDSQAWIAMHAGRDGPDCYSSGPMSKPPTDDGQKARVELSDYLSGRLIGAQLPLLDDASIESGAERGVAAAQEKRVEGRKDDAVESTRERWERRSALLAKRQAGDESYGGYASWANAYSGHQFGQWAGQLGDGRAITLMETFDERTGQRWEIQLKGGGRTPFSRFADGLAALFSSVREYLASEAVHGLGIPTSRALSLISVRDVSVRREREHPAAVTSRLAPIWTRVGSFEHHATRKEWESVRLLGEFTCREGYGWKDVGEHDKQDASSAPWAERLLRECATRNATMVARWQASGFMHGVMNSDNISLLGLTIDYGPYGFMDIFDRYTICNKSDSEGRYSFHMQPTAAMFVMEQLTSSLALLVGFEREQGRAARPGELVALNEEKCKELGRATQEQLWPQIKELFMDKLIDDWQNAWRARLALKTVQEDDRTALIDPLLDIFEGYLDFTHSMRRLCKIAPLVESRTEGKELDADVEGFLDTWLEWEQIPSFARDQRRTDAAKWVNKYVERLLIERTSASTLEADLKAANPSFILRNWVTDEVVKRLQEKDDTAFLSRILHMSLHPFDGWGEEEAGKSAEQLAEEQRLCSIGAPLTSNMPSCSS